ncbi:unnamed protein product [Adineta steineri]|uniref:Uncharacterized protein n=1 Tax=Adineta steineri TaxID=433720 RepID=A0A815NF96_9BILA|nr:unnamed protein product [Adineta steineri]CAF0980073.1 unnamed protein product [Adineta steineri]CAF1006487.1 unnamed protein product [Adineta steineri]CAF1438726.1 unnamed protein product [Adineta steineri]
MGTTDEKHLELIETIFNRFLIQTQSDNPQLSRDYFERFTQLLNQTFQKYPQLKSSIETIILSIILPFHSSNNVTFEYQLRLIRFSLRQHLHILELNKNDFLNRLCYHSLLNYSSIVRHLSLQIAILIYEHDLYQSFDEQFFTHIIKIFSPDPNLYVRNTLAQFLALYLSKHDQYQLFDQIQKHSLNSDLIYHILILLDQDKQQLLIKELNIYENLSDTTAIRAFVLKTAKYVLNEDQLVFYLNRILEKSLSDYVHMLLSIISSRYEYQQPIIKLNACLKALFLYMQETEIEEIDEHEQNLAVDQEDEFGELTEYICCHLYERNIEAMDLASIVLDAIQPLTSNSESFLYKLDFYSSTIVKMLNGENNHDKNFAQLINCFGKLQQFKLLNNNLDDIIIEHIKNKTRTTLVYQALFNLILNTPNRIYYLESLYTIIEKLLFQDTDKLLQWDNKDSILHFFIQLIKTTTNISKHDKYPSWFNNEFLQRIIEKFVHNNNEYIQGSLIDFLATLVEYDLLSPLDNYLTSNFIQLTEYSLGDVVRCALAHAWYIILTKANNNDCSINQYEFSFGNTINRESLSTIVIAQIPLLIGDGGHETEIQCLHLIEFIGGKTKELENVLDFLISDGCSNEIKEKARQLLSVENNKTTEKKSNEILEDELSSILHWLEHPDEHMILDCD